MSDTKKPKMIIGALENCNLPEFGIADLQIRVDTGAKTSSLHVDKIKKFKKKGKTWVSFLLHPDIYHLEETVECKAQLKDIRTIKSSNGESEQRYVIETDIELGDRSWPIEITLTDRRDMSYLMLFGRQGMRKRVLVDPSQNFILSTSEDS
jgi:hypothetical protein